jgi:hypothetical protein
VRMVPTEGFGMHYPKARNEATWRCIHYIGVSTPSSFQIDTEKGACGKRQGGELRKQFRSKGSARFNF